MSDVAVHGYGRRRKRPHPDSSSAETGQLSNNSPPEGSGSERANGRDPAASHPKKTTGMTGATEFVALINGTTVAEGDELVQVVVGTGKDSKTFNLSKKHLTSVSGYFRGTFSGDWKEANSQIVKLEEDDPLTFELVVQWTYCRHAVLPDEFPPPNDKNPHKAGIMHEGLRKIRNRKFQEKLLFTKADCILAFLKFLRLADYLYIHGPVETSIEPMMEYLIADPDTLEPLHIQMAGALPGGRPIIRLFAQSCVKSYMRSRFNWEGSDEHEFKYSEELESVEGFAFELLQSIPVGKIVEGIFKGSERIRYGDDPVKAIKAKMDDILKL